MIRTALLFLFFAFIHSITVAQRFKHFCKGMFGETFMRVWYRFLYNAVSIATAVAAFVFIVQVPDRVIWTLPSWLRWAMHGVQVVGLAFGVLAFEHMDAGEFMGARQVWRYLARREVAGNIEGITEKELVITGVYGIVRHPMYLAGIIIVTFSPIITVNGLTLTVLANLYFLFGVFMEERRFQAVFGERYREYMNHVPRLVPRIAHFRKR